MTDLPEYKHVTVRGRGKTHRATVEMTGNFKGYMHISCSCPGSQNGRLKKQVSIVCDGWEAANCGN